MSTEDLLKPRYKCIADYPSSPFPVGYIVGFEQQVHPYDGSGELVWETKWVGESKYFEYYFSQHPHLFKKMEWWEERKPDEMPEYLNCPSRKMFFRVESWHKSYFIIDGRQKMQYRNYLPATLAEYEQYINQKEKQ